MKARDAINATATVLSQMSPDERVAVARVITAPAIRQDQIHNDVVAIATRSIQRDARDKRRFADQMADIFDGVFKR